MSVDASPPRRIGSARNAPSDPRGSINSYYSTRSCLPSVFPSRSPIQEGRLPVLFGELLEEPLLGVVVPGEIVEAVLRGVELALGDPGLRVVDFIHPARGPVDDVLEDARRRRHPRRGLLLQGR